MTMGAQRERGFGVESSLWGNKERPREGELSSPSPAPALQWLRGTTDLALELAELEEECAACQDLRAR